MQHSYFLLPEAFDNDEILYAAIDDLHDVDAIWLLDDFPEEGGIPEDVFVTVLLPEQHVEILEKGCALLPHPPPALGRPEQHIVMPAQVLADGPLVSQKGHELTGSVIADHGFPEG